MSTFGPNQERYAKASQPHADDSAAKAALDRFFTRVTELREELMIPEVLVVAMANHGRGESVSSAAFFGNAALAPSFGAAAFREFTAPTIERANRLESIAFGKESA